MTDLTEYGDVLVNAVVDEWGRRRINGVLEDGTKIIVTSGVILKTVADYLELFDSLLTSKPLLPVADSIVFADYILRDKIIGITDGVAALDVMKGDKNPLTVSDVLSLADFVDALTAIVKVVADAVSLADAVLTLKTLNISDTLTLLDAAATPLRVLQALDAISLGDTALVNKVLVVTESISLAEVVEVGVGGVKKTRLFLILGDLAVQLTGD